MIKPIVFLLSLTISSFSFAEENKGLNLFGGNSSNTIKSNSVSPSTPEAPKKFDLFSAKPKAPQKLKPIEIFSKDSPSSKQVSNNEVLNTSSKPSLSKMGDNFFITNPNGSKLICYKEVSDKTCEVIN